MKFSFKNLSNIFRFLIVYSYKMEALDELPENCVAVISYRKKFRPKYFFYELGTLNFYYKNLKDSKYYKCKYTILNGLVVFFWDHSGDKLHDMRISTYLNSLNKQMNNQYFKTYPELRAFSKHHGSSIAKIDHKIKLITFEFEPNPCYKTKSFKYIFNELDSLP